MNCNGKLISLDRPKVMGILNVTPDSFFDGGKYTNADAIAERTKKIVAEGADIIDIGAYSSRPNADDVPENEEIKRLELALQIVRDLYPDAIISVDTFRANVARFAVEKFNVDIINDIYAGTADDQMLQTIRDLQVPYVMMHIQGTPQTMQNNPTYDDIVADIIKYFSERINKANLLGINDIIIDPGFGFGKSIDQNYELMRRLDEFSIIDYPLLVGISRKSMLYRYLGVSQADVLAGTTTLDTIALHKGAKIIRVHDVAEAVQSVKIFEKVFS